MSSPRRDYSLDFGDRDLAELNVGLSIVGLQLDCAGFESQPFPRVFVFLAIVGPMGCLIAVHPGGDVLADGDDGHREGLEIAGNQPPRQLPVVDRAGAVARGLRWIFVVATVEQLRFVPIHELARDRTEEDPTVDQHRPHANFRLQYEVAVPALQFECPRAADGAHDAIPNDPAGLALIGELRMAEDGPSREVAAVEYRLEPGRLQQQCRYADRAAELDWPRLFYGQGAGECS